jgi:hypothetical protein
MLEPDDLRHLLEIRNRITRFNGSLTTYGGSYVPEEILLRKIELSEGAKGASREMTQVSGPNQSVTLASMPRWLVIPFPRRAAEETGIFGTSVLIEDVLTWTYGGRDDEKADYALALANALRSSPEPRPHVDDPSWHHRQRLAALIRIIDACETDATAFSSDEKLSVCMHLRDALDTVENGERSTNTGFSYPIDMMPMANSDGIVSREMGFEAGWALRRMMDHADYVDEDERRRIRMALDYFPDRHIDIEVALCGLTTMARALRSHQCSANMSSPCIGRRLIWMLTESIVTSFSWSRTG